MTFGTGHGVARTSTMSRMNDLTPNARVLLRAAGVIALVLAGLPALLSQFGFAWLGRTPVLSTPSFLLWSGAAAVYALAFWWTTAAAGHERLRGRGTALLVVQTAAALTMFHLVCSGLESTQLVVVAAQLGFFVGLRTGVAAVLAIAGIQTWIGILHFPLSQSLSWAGTLTLPYSFLALLTAHLAEQHRAGRGELARANAELRATQVLLTDSVRIAERVRISRELHDLMGHHLTGLSLNLETARHLVRDKAVEHVQQCQVLTKQLLTDVREAVSSLRGSDTVDLDKALRPLVAGIRRPRIHLTLPKDAARIEPQRAHALVRCVQEVITNSVRHANADNLWIEFVRSGDGLQVRAHDDGAGAGDVTPGHGLRGMRERLEALGGRLEVTSPSSRGFQLDAWIPLRGGAL